MAEMPLPPQGYTITDSGLFVPQGIQASASSDVRHPTAWLSEMLGGGRFASRVFVSPATSLGLSTYYACIRAIAEDCAKLPLQVFERLGRGRRRAAEHWLWRILHDQFNDDMTAFTAREVMTHYALGWGNGYGLILRDQSMTARDGEPMGIYPIHPARVRVSRDSKRQRLLYSIESSLYGRERGDFPVVIDMADMLHIRGPSPDGLMGYSIAQIAAESLGLSLAAQSYGANFFGNSGRPGGVLSHPGKLSDTARVNLRESWERAHSGPENAGKTAILEEGITWAAISIPPEQAQFLETRAFQVREVARWFRMPLSKIADLSDAKWANIEQQNIDYVVDTLTPWLVRWEQEIQMKLLPDDSAYYAKHNVNSLLRGDMQARSEYYRTMIANGIYSPNEVREFEDMNAYEGGDNYFMQLNMAAVPDIVNGTARQRRAVRTRGAAMEESVARNGHHHPENAYAP